MNETAPSAFLRRPACLLACLLRDAGGAAPRLSVDCEIRNPLVSRQQGSRNGQPHLGENYTVQPLAGLHVRTLYD